MKHLVSKTPTGCISIIAGSMILASLLPLPFLPSLRGLYVTNFLGYFFIASLGYVIALLRLTKDKLPIRLIWGFAILFRVVLLFSEPSLSDDVYRYIWDGHLLNQGVNPYTYPVDTPQLDPYTIPLRANVNHAWMASPYLPSSQFLFGLVTRILPESIKAFQVTAVVLDLLTGWLVLDILRLLKLPKENVLIYLWNPLVVVEFAHGAHNDAQMIIFLMFTFWLLLKADQTGRNIFNYASIISLMVATLTKLLPILIAPLLIRRWGWKKILLFIGLVLLVLSLFAVDSGWGIIGPLDGTGIFGAFRIYTKWWNFNSGIYHWLEVLISGYPTPGAVPVDIVGERPITIAKLITLSLFAITLLYAFWQTQKKTTQTSDIISLSIIPLGAYLLLTPTLHPWYVTLLIPFLPLLPRQHRWPWIYLSLAVVLSYVTYLNPNDLREYAWVRWVEYFPMYGLLTYGLFIIYRKVF